MKIMKSIIKYLRNSKEELFKVTWPTKQQTINTTVLVVVFSAGIAAFLGGLDYGLSQLLDKLLVYFQN